MREDKRGTENREFIYNAILEDFGTLGDGLTGLLYDGVGVVLDGASEVVIVADFDGFVHRRSQPRHDCSRPLRVGIRRLKSEATNLFRVWNITSENDKIEKKVRENQNEHRPSLCLTLLFASYRISRGSRFRGSTTPFRSSNLFFFKFHFSLISKKSLVGYSTNGMNSFLKM